MYLLFIGLPLHAQFAPGLGIPGCTAMHKDSSAFVAWAQSASVTRGWQQLYVDSLGLASAGSEADATGKPGTNGVVSLGDGGSAILDAGGYIFDGPGPDFAVFENSFDGMFLELAFVEVSSDGVHFFRFPSHSHSDTLNGTGSFGYTNPEKIHNLAGKYPLFYGTPFDLAEIEAPELDKEHIRFVRIEDVVGTIRPEWARRDSEGRMIADPWPTPFAGSGFDLDGMGVVHFQPLAVTEPLTQRMHIFPQPASNRCVIELPFSERCHAIVYDLQGRPVFEGDFEQRLECSTETWASGIYWLRVIGPHGFVETQPIQIAR